MPSLQSDQIVKCGKTAHRNRGWLPEVKQLIIEMSLNASGVRDTARSLHISTDTVLSELKKKEPALESVNTKLLRTAHRQ
jgi:transposase-like protein